MPKLVANTIVDGVIYEAGTTPPADVAARITRSSAWDEPPAPASSGEGFDWIESDAAAPSGSGDGGEGPGGVGADTDATPAPTLSWAAELAGLPDDREMLLTFADDHGLDVNRRLGVDNLRAAIVSAMGA